MGKISSLILLSNGIEPGVIKEIKSKNYEKLRGLVFGLLNIFISILSAVLLGVYIYQQSEMPWVSIAAAVMWFWFYLLLAIAVQIGLRKEKGKFLLNLIKAVPRALLAVVLSLLITDPAILYFLQPDIKNEQRFIAERMEKTTFEEKKNYYTSDKRKSDFDRLNSEKERLNNDLATKENLLNKRSDELNAQGVSVTNKKIGSFRGSFNTAQKSYNEAKKLADERLPKIEEELGQLTAEIEKQSRDDAEKARKEIEKDTGYIGQHKALFHLMNREPFVAFKVIIIFLAALLFELTPLTAKILSPYSAYESKLDELQAADMSESKILRERLGAEEIQEKEIAEIKKESQINLANQQRRFQNDIHKLITDSIMLDTPVPNHLMSLREEILTETFSQIRQLANSAKTVANMAEDENEIQTEIQLEFPEKSKKIFYTFEGKAESIMFEKIIPGVAKLLSELNITAEPADLKTLSGKYNFTNRKGDVINPNRPLISQLNGDLTLLMHSAT